MEDKHKVFIPALLGGQLHLKDPTRSTHVPPFRHFGVLGVSLTQSSTLMEQSEPSHPVMHRQIYPPLTFVQVAPFLHALGNVEHSSTSISQRFPVKLDGQLQQQYDSIFISTKESNIL